MTLAFEENSTLCCLELLSKSRKTLAEGAKVSFWKRKLTFVARSIAHTEQISIQAAYPVDVSPFLRHRLSTTVASGEGEAYMLPRNTQESQRLDAQHEYMRQMSHGHLKHPSIPVQKLHAVADVATGTG